MKYFKAEVTYTSSATAIVYAKNKKEAIALIREGQYEDFVSEEMLDDTLVIDESSVVEERNE